MAASLSVIGSMCFPGNGVRAATGPYTLPFFDPSIGVFRGYTASHPGIDYAMAYKPVAAARQGVVEEMREDLADSGLCTSSPVSGNYVLLSHADGQHTLYLHLKQNGVSVSPGSLVSAGQVIGTSGNSGYSCGAHLHYALFRNNDWDDPADALNPGGRWTTDPGRVPWLGQYVRESNNAEESIPRYTTKFHWVEFANVGGRTWSASNDSYGRGRVYLSATNEAGNATRQSAFRASDWPSGHRATDVDATTPPGATGRFTFGLYAAPPYGVYYEYFNVRADSLHWFDITNITSFYVPIRVIYPPN